MTLRWSTGAHATLVEMASREASARAIGLVLGVSRNAVIGRARREGVKLRDRLVASRLHSKDCRRGPRGRGDAFRILAIAATLLGETQHDAAVRLGCSVSSIAIWKHDPLLVEKARALAGRVMAKHALAAERVATFRLNEVRRSFAEAPLRSPLADPLTPYWRAKVDQACRDFPVGGVPA